MRAFSGSRWQDVKIEQGQGVLKRGSRGTEVGISAGRGA